MRWLLACLSLATLFCVALGAVVVRSRVGAARHRLARAEIRCAGLEVELGRLAAWHGRATRREVLLRRWHDAVHTSE